MPPDPATQAIAGFVNAHTHIYSALAPLGMPAPARPPASFLEILERIWWRLDRALDERALRASARLYAAEALLRGTTTLVDHHESPAFIDGSLDVIADECQKIGIRAVLCFGVTERNGGRDEARRGLAECRRFIRSNARPLVRGVVGLHASFTVSDETVREAGDLARELGTVVHVHVAEDGADVRDAVARGYDGPLERLRDLGGLPEGSILAHGVHLSRDQVHVAAAMGCWIVQNPRSNRGNRVGYPGALGESARVALGTDGYPADMREELRALLDEARAHGEDESAVRRRLDAGHALATERFGVAIDPDTGEISGDIVAPGFGSANSVGPIFRSANAPLDVAPTFRSANTQPGGAPTFGSADMATVIVASRTVVRDGELQTADLAAIRAEAREAAPRLWARMRDLGP